jgi:hypothetical protein
MKEFKVLRVYKAFCKVDIVLIEALCIYAMTADEALDYARMKPNTLHVKISD